MRDVAIEEFPTLVDYPVEIEWEFADADVLKGKLLTDLAAQAGRYDLPYVQFWWIPDFVSQEYLEPLEKYIEDDRTPWPIAMDDFYQGFVGLLKYKGKQYAIPVQPQTGGLIIYKIIYDPIAPLGRDPDGNPIYPDTLDEVEEAARIITEKAPEDVYAFVARGAPTFDGAYPMLGWGYAEAGPMFTDDMKCRLTEPAWIKAMDQYARIGREYGPPGMATFSWPEEHPFFSTGKVAMQYSCPIVTDLLQGPVLGFENIVTLSAPKGTYGRATVAFTNSFGIGKYSDHKEEAWDLLRFLVSPGLRKRVAKEAADFTFRPSLLEDPEYVALFESDYLKVRDAMAPYDNPEWYPRMLGGPEIATSLAKQVSSCMAGEIDIQTAMQTAKEDIDRIVEEKGLERYWTAYD